MNEITFGRYSPYNTCVHRLDPRNKIFLMILLMVSIFFQFSLWSTSLIISVLLLFILIIFMIIGKINFISLFKSLSSMWFLVIFLMIVYIFIPNPTYSHVLYAWNNGFKLYWDSFYQCGYIILRLIMMISITMLLTSTTKPMDLTYGLEWYMTPLKYLHFPVHEVAMTLSIALRFIPTILDETDRIMKAQASRGVDFNRGGLFKRFKAVISLIIPLFVSSIERSEELSNAMEARGYDPKGKRSKYRLLKFHLSDLFTFIIIGLIFGSLLTLLIFDKQHQIDIIYFVFGVKVGF